MTWMELDPARVHLLPRPCPLLPGIVAPFLRIFSFFTPLSLRLQAPFPTY
jgi:hypothetical protein